MFKQLINNLIDLMLNRYCFAVENTLTFVVVIYAKIFQNTDKLNSLIHSSNQST